MASNCKTDAQKCVLLEALKSGEHRQREYSPDPTDGKLDLVHGGLFDYSNPQGARVFEA
jgi:hypothetical protein